MIFLRMSRTARNQNGIFLLSRRINLPYIFHEPTLTTVKSIIERDPNPKDPIRFRGAITNRITTSNNSFQAMNFNRYIHSLATTTTS